MLLGMMGCAGNAISTRYQAIQHINFSYLNYAKCKLPNEDHLVELILSPIPSYIFY